MLAGSPFICSRLVACAAQAGVRGDRHRRGWMSGLVWTVTGFTGNPFLYILAGFRVITSCVAFQARHSAALSGPVTLEDGGGECLGMACKLPLVVDILMTLGTGF